MQTAECGCKENTPDNAEIRFEMQNPPNKSISADDEST